ncbi:MULTISPECIES: hypothetical protein [Cysteiniphilum]|uniref:hypothetical protein n=1 Tax=Cysteiniphilum TaxID=2056696 RepID=UPI001783E3D3|nr:MULTISPECIES: hypothetical protein [Cysteiniphilum]
MIKISHSLYILILFPFLGFSLSMHVCVYSDDAQNTHKYQFNFNSIDDTNSYYPLSVKVNGKGIFCSPDSDTLLYTKPIMISGYEVGDYENVPADINYSFQAFITTDIGQDIYRQIAPNTNDNSGTFDHPMVGIVANSSNSNSGVYPQITTGKKNFVNTLQLSLGPVMSGLNYVYCAHSGPNDLCQDDGSSYDVITGGIYVIWSPKHELTSLIPV